MGGGLILLVGKTRWRGEENSSDLANRMTGSQGGLNLRGITGKEAHPGLGPGPVMKPSLATFIHQAHRIACWLVGLRACLSLLRVCECCKRGGGFMHCDGGDDAC